MEIIDISQEVFHCEVFPGDRKPEKKKVCTIDENTIYNLTDFSMCAHNGTHVDAPYHFYADGKTIDQIEMKRLVGKAYVCHKEGELSEKDALEIMEKARKLDTEAAKRILIGGDATVTLQAAQVFAKEEIYLIGNESQTVGPVNAPAAVHYELLKKDIVLLEGIRLKEVKEGVYTLCAAPINLGGSDGAPCRAILIRE